MNQNHYKYETGVLVKEEGTQCSFLNPVEQLKLNRARFLIDGGCSDPVWLVLLKSSSTKMEVFIVIFGVTETIIVQLWDDIPISRFKNVCYNLYPKCTSLFSSFEDCVGGEKYHNSPTFHKSSQIPMDHIPLYIISQ